MDPDRARRWGLALLALNLAWRTVRYALDFPLWGDEAFVAVNLDARGFVGLFQPLEYGQIAPLGWLWMEDLLRNLLGPSTAVLRLPAFLAGCVSAVLMFRLCFRLAPGAGGLLGFAIFAASYYPMRHGAELKPYAFDLLFALLILITAMRLAEGDRRRRVWAGFAASCLLGVFFSYPSLFVTAASITVLGVSGLRCGARAALLRLSLLALAWAACALWMLIAFAGPHAAAAAWLTEMAMWTPAFPEFARPWTWPRWLLEAHAGYMSAYPSGGRHFGSSATLLLILVGVFAWRPPRRALLLGLLLGPLLFTFVAALLEKYPYGGSVRVSIFLAPAFCLLAGCGLAAILARLRSEARVAPLLCLALAVMPIGGIAEDIAHPYKILADRRCEEFTSELAARVRPGDRVLGLTTATPDGGPDWFALGGSGARLRWMLARKLPESAQLTWHLTPPVEGRLWLLTYADDNDTLNPFPQERFEQLLARLSSARGAPRLQETYSFENAERVDLLLFDAVATRR